MVIKVKRSLLIARLLEKKQQVARQHKADEAAYLKAVEKYPAVLIAELDAIRKMVERGTFNKGNGHRQPWKGKVSLEVTAPPVKPTPPCRGRDIDEMVAVLRLSDEEFFQLSEKSKYYDYACKIR